MNDPIKASDWDDDQIRGIQEIYNQMVPQAKAQIDLIAKTLFVQMKMVGLAFEWPETWPQLDKTHLAKLYHIAMILNSVEGLA